MEVDRLRRYFDNLELSSVTTDLTTAVAQNTRREIQKNLYQLFGVGVGGLDEIFANGRVLTDKAALQRVSDHYGKRAGRSTSGEIDIYLYAQKPAGGWKRPRSSMTTALVPLGQKSFNCAVTSLNSHQSRPYSIPISPPTSETDLLNLSINEANMRQQAAYYVIFEATSRQTWVPDKLDQLERQLAFLLFRYHGAASKKGDKYAVGDWLAQEVLRLIAFAGFGVTEAWTMKLENRLHNKIFRAHGYDYPCLWSLWNNADSSTSKKNTLVRDSQCLKQTSQK
ncbi:hypothetical protein HK102_001577 [Quaeritorhiza haematococci]|nr:hypothetical protein HK102_001577 [Quaeritorhiza haematococci]